MDTTFGHETSDDLVAQNSGFDESILPDCGPSKFYFSQDIEKVMGKSSEELQEVSRYYTSKLIGIQKDENPPYDILYKDTSEMTPVELNRFKDFVTKMTQLLDNDDVCDKEGVIFLAKFFRANIERVGEPAHQLNTLISSYAKELLISNNSGIVKYAKKLNHI